MNTCKLDPVMYAPRTKRDKVSVTDLSVTSDWDTPKGRGILASLNRQLDNIHPDQPIAVDTEQRARQGRRTNPDSLNYGAYLTADQLHDAGLKANRVPIPGDSDYKGVCVKVDGVWRVKAA